MKKIMFTLKKITLKYLSGSLCLLFISLAAASQKSRLQFTIHFNDTVQQVRNIGASGCWFSEEIGSSWPEAKKQLIAERLFSREVSATGQPKGIGLSAWRFNIGAGTAEQGAKSGIKDPARRVECFLSPDGSYNWNKQEGYRWMLQQAKRHGVENLIAFVNSPPVQFTKNGLGFKLEKDYTTNLKAGREGAYAQFLTTVLKHFDSSGLPFHFISPVNEPQWDWTGTPGEAKQEGSPWTNEEIVTTTKALDSSLSSHGLTTKILLPEAAMLNYLYAGNGNASRQVATFWNKESPLYLGDLPHATPFVEGHSYFTDTGDSNLIATRRSLRDTIKKYGPQLEYWQSEYCMLGEGFLEGQKTQKRSAIDCALFLAKVIHHDFTVGNATAWHYWNAYEPGPADSNTRYYLIAMNPDRATDTANLFTITKNLWALGHYSLFIRPGMYRVETSSNYTQVNSTTAQQVMFSAFRDGAGKKLVVNVINYTTEEKTAAVKVKGLLKNNTLRLVKRYVTTAKAGDDLKPYPIGNDDNNLLTLPARSISTFVFAG